MGESICKHSRVLHQHRDSAGRAVIETYTVAAVREGVALLSAPGVRGFRRVPVATLERSAAWAVQGTLF
jgi:hypothetical protein